MNNFDEVHDRFCKICMDNPFCPPKYFIPAVSPATLDVLFIDYHIMLGCPHAKTFGNGFYCNCAERIKFYIKSGK